PHRLSCRPFSLFLGPISLPILSVAPCRLTWLLEKLFLLVLAPIFWILRSWLERLDFSRTIVVRCKEGFVEVFVFAGIVALDSVVFAELCSIDGARRAGRGIPFSLGAFVFRCLRPMVPSFSSYD